MVHRLVRLLPRLRPRRARRRGHQRDRPQAAGRADRGADAACPPRSSSSPPRCRSNCSTRRPTPAWPRSTACTSTKRATARQAAVFHEDFNARADAEAEVLRQLQATLVVADIPPLACAAADRAGVPSVVLGNFTWDWIYAAYPQFETHRARRRRDHRRVVCAGDAGAAAAAARRIRDDANGRPRHPVHRAQVAPRPRRGAPRPWAQPHGDRRAGVVRRTQPRPGLRRNRTRQPIPSAPDRL